MNIDDIDYSVIIPVASPNKIKSLKTLLTKFASQTHPPKEIHLIIGDNRQGRAINYGVKMSSTKYISTVDDDTEFDNNTLFEKLINVIKNDGSIGMVGAACEIPPYASSFQKKAMQQIPRRFFPKQEENIDSDMVQHPCLLMEKDFFLKIGGEDEEIIRGLDPLLRKKVRDSGKRVVIAANTWVYHILPNSFFKLIKMYYRNGRGSAFAKKYFPDKIYELTDGYEKGKFIEKRLFIFRIFRRILKTLYAIFSFKFLKFFSDIAYISGYLSEFLFPTYNVKSEIKEIKTQKDELSGIQIFYHFISLKK